MAVGPPGAQPCPSPSSAPSSSSLTSSSSLPASSPSSVATRSVHCLFRLSSMRPNRMFQIPLLAMSLLQVCSHACNLPLSQVAAVQGRVVLAGVSIRENVGTFRQIYGWERLRGGGEERPDVERVCVVGSGNWGSTVARIIGQNTVRLGEKFDRSVKMWV